MKNSEIFKALDFSARLTFWAELTKQEDLEEGRAHPGLKKCEMHDKHLRLCNMNIQWTEIDVY